jgi:hypothetical protein
MKISKSLVQLTPGDVKDALMQYALNAHQERFGVLTPGSFTVEVGTREEKSTVVGMRPREIENVCADITFSKRREQMPVWAKELRERLKPLYKDKGELYYNRRKDYIAVKLHTRFSFVIRNQNPYDWNEVEGIVREVCHRHNKYVTKVQPYLFHVWDSVPAHLQKPVVATGIAQDMRPE